MDTAQANSRLYSLDEVVEILHTILTRRRSEITKQQQLHTDLTLLAYYIQSTRSELTQISAMNPDNKFIQSTTDELGAVIGETAQATEIIMSACENIELAAKAAEGPLHTALTKAVTSIYEACSFQDITGQRITKVIKTLGNIEKKVAESLAVFRQDAAPPPQASPPQDNSLLNGPQLNGPLMSQEEIDKFLDIFEG
jgi:chemotaxis protein CheZ